MICVLPHRWKALFKLSRNYLHTEMSNKLILTSFLKYNILLPVHKETYILVCNKFSF